MVKAEGTDILHSYIEVRHISHTKLLFYVAVIFLPLQYMFMTEVDSSRKKAVHDELARLLVQYLRQQSADEDHIPKLLDVREGMERFEGGVN